MLGRMGTLLDEARRRGELLDRLRREGAAFDVAAWSVAEARRLVLQALAGTGVDAWLFGSRAWGGARAASDLDVALDGHGRPVPEVASRVREALEESLIPYTCDVVDLAEAAPALAEAVRRRGVRWTG